MNANKRLPHPTHLGEIFTILRQRLRGRPTGFHGADRLTLELIAHRGDSLTALLSDPYDQRRYELRLRPLDGLSEAAGGGRTCQYPSSTTLARPTD